MNINGLVLSTAHNIPGKTSIRTGRHLIAKSPSDKDILPCGRCGAYEGDNRGARDCPKTRESFPGFGLSQDNDRLVSDSKKASRRQDR